MRISSAWLKPLVKEGILKTPRLVATGAWPTSCLP